jgi:hypothetical protein
VVANLLRAADYAADVRRRTGRTVQVALEPEPDCLLESTDDIMRFFAHSKFRRGPAWRDHLGVCLDTCHFAVRFEDPADCVSRAHQAGIGIFKVQLSAALETTATTRTLQALRAFCDPVYLHQVTVRKHSKTTTWPDLAVALDALPFADDATWRVHCHVPLYFNEHTGLRSTSGALTPSFFREAAASGTRHFEIETYTMAVLPQWLKRAGVVESIREEYRWVMDRL